MPFQVYQAESRSILSPTTGFIREAGFTHSLTPARNCTFGCSYCYVPTMGVYGGLKPDDWRAWGQFTTFKSNAAELLGKSLRGGEAIYCSPLVDPYQPAEADACLMPGVLEAVAQRPPRVFTIQTRGPLVLRDLHLLQQLAKRTKLRISFSLTSDREDVRRIFEPHCATIPERLDTMRALRSAGIETYATLAPVLPCDPEALVRLALSASDQDIVADPLHVRAVKKHGATTREAAVRISAHHDFSIWLDPVFQAEVIQRMTAIANQSGRRMAAGTEGFGWLAK